jgi:hypothetical protein
MSNLEKQRHIYKQRASVLADSVGGRTDLVSTAIKEALGENEPTPENWLIAINNAKVPCTNCDGTGIFKLHSRTYPCYPCASKGHINIHDAYRNYAYQKYKEKERKEQQKELF